MTASTVQLPIRLPLRVFAGFALVYLALALLWAVAAYPMMTRLVHNEVLREQLSTVVFVLVGPGLLFAYWIKYSAQLHQCQSHVMRMLELLDAPWWDHDMQLGIDSVSPRWCKLLGYAPDELPARPGLLRGLVHHDDQIKLEQIFTHGGAGPEEERQLDLRLRHKDGHYVPLQTSYRRISETGGKRSFISGVCMDMRERMQIDAQLRQAAIVLQSTREGVMITDASGHITMVNEAFSAISGYAASEAVGRTSSLLQSGRHDNEFYRAMWAHIQQQGQWQGEIWNRRKTGEVYPEILNISAVHDGAGDICSYVGVFADISTVKASEQVLHFLVHHDPLTKLPNRVLFLTLLQHSLKKSVRDQRCLALLVLDLDRFKDLNDSYGHAAGDELLQLVAERLRHRFRDIDTVARLGGDEFGIMLTDLAEPESVARIANEVVQMFNSPWRLADGLEVRLGGSIGISLFPEHGVDAGLLLQHADAALYRAKQEGRACFRYFSESLSVAARDRVDMEARLHHAISGGELRVHYQPQVDMASGAIIGAEALVRWEDSEQGLIAPSRFIPIAEASNLINEIGAWVMMQACAQGRAWLDAGQAPLVMAVNISPRQFLHGDILAMVENTLRVTGFPAAYLELELTESVLMENEGEVIALLDRLRGIGVRIAIDDFGTGYSSLSYLKRFPVDILKIDKSFVDALPHGQDDLAISAAIVAMGHALGFKILAEGVEHEEQLACLRSQGCDIFQGYLCSRPVPAAQFAALLGST